MIRLKGLSTIERKSSKRGCFNNFPKFILRTHLLMMVNNLRNVPYHLSLMFKLFSPRQVVKKVTLIFFYSLFPQKQAGETVVFSQVDEQDQAVRSEAQREGQDYIYPHMHQQAQLLQGK